MASFTIENIFGVGSFRICSGFPSSFKSVRKTDDFIYECSINGCLQIYNYSTNERTFFEHVSDDILVVMIYNEFTNQILTCSYSGRIILWSADYQKRVIDQQARIDHVHYGFWTKDGTTIYLCSRFDGTIISLNYDVIHRSLTENWLRHWATPRSDLEKLHPNIEEPITTPKHIETSHTYVAGSIGYEYIISTAMRRHVFAVLQRPQKHVHIHELNLQDGHLLNDLILDKAKANQTFLCGTTTTIINQQLGKEFFAIGLQSGSIFIIDTNPLQIHATINAIGSPQAMIWWHSNLLTIGYTSSIVNVFSLDGTLIASGDGAPTTAVNHLQWNSEKQDHLWIGGYMGLALVHIELFDSRTPSPSPTDKVMFTILNTIVDEDSSSAASICLTSLLQKSYHLTAGCGLYLDNNRIISGDLSGNIIHWLIDNYHPQRQNTISDSVRCIISDELVGTLSGALYDITKEEILEDFQTSIICSSWNRNRTKCLIGLADGRLVEYFSKKLIGLHANNAEIWSVCWSSNEDLCATASEDQTTCVWKVDGEQELIATLTGHTTAVTAVQWKSERIYTCADDRTVRIYNTANYQCLNVLQTPKSLFGWFTLTYLQVDEEKQWIICTTQNGYLVIWHGENEILPILCKKIHFGSLEGLAYDSNTQRVVTIGSDCIVTCLRLHTH